MGSFLLFLKGEKMANYCETVELYLNEAGEVGVLVSPDFGAGWSTWNSEQYAYDKRIVEKFIKSPDLFHEVGCMLTSFMESLGYDGYYGGARDLCLVYIPKGIMFRIDEYDGSERIELFDPNSYISF